MNKLESMSNGNKSSTDIESEIKLMESSIDEKAQQLNQLLILIKEEREKGNKKIINERESLQQLNEKFEKNKESSMLKNEQAKQEILDLQKQLLELQKKTSLSEVQLQRLLSTPNPTISQEEFAKLKEESTASLLFIQQKYQQLQVYSKSREEELKNTFFSLNEQEKSLKAQLL